MKVVTILGMMVLFFSSCQKIMDFYSLNSTVEGGSTPCKIKSFASTLYESVNRTVIHYNDKGNPWRIVYFADWLPDGKSIEYLRYDELDRLIAHETDPMLGNYYRIYVYEGNSRTPLRDTAIDSQGKKYVETFKADVKGRIIEEEIRWIYTPPEIEDDFEFKTERKRFFYDLKGNRQVNPYDHPWHKPLLYSQRASLYSLNPSWQIIHRDYSKNGIENVATFTERGLPISFKLNEFAYWPPFLDMNQRSRVAYDCIDAVK